MYLYVLNTINGILINVDIHISLLKSITMGIYYYFLYDNDVILPYKGKTECRYPAVLHSPYCTLIYWFEQNGRRELFNLIFNKYLNS